jgi:hypothetical protein
MDWKTVRGSLHHVAEKEIFWLVGYAALTGSIVAKSIAWLFYAETVTSRAVLDLWTMTFSNDIVFSIWLVFGIECVSADDGEIDGRVDNGRTSL